MIVPLQAAGRTLGAITFVSGASGRTFSTADLEVVEELGRRAGSALERARFVTRRSEIARTFESAALPASLPGLPGYEMSARYVPGEASEVAGGDWYDVFVLRDGRCAMAVGDAAGRGAAAAAAAGPIRNALRAYALQGTPPAAVIDQLHALADGDSAITFMTLVHLLFDPATGIGEIAGAGHPPPLIGGVGYIDMPRCPPLGFSNPPPCIGTTFQLAPGATLWLYTNGLVASRRRPLDAGLALLSDVAGSVNADLSAVADELLVRVPDARDDDIVIVGVRRQAS